ncbi:MAG: hypothetical protein ACYC3P_13410 [Bellilinea sp.]
MAAKTGWPRFARRLIDSAACKQRASHSGCKAAHDLTWSCAKTAT